MKHFFVISNESKDKDLQTANRIKEYLEQKQCVCKVATDYGADTSKEFSTDIEEKPEETECIIVVGGDGTLLQAANDVYKRDLPMFGVNMGTLGFLTDIEKHQIYGALDLLRKDAYKIEERMLLEGSYRNEQGEQVTKIALNDVVLNKGRFYHLVSVKIYINNELLDQYIADGVIVSSPTGSTGYNLSAGGPVMLPTMEGIIITPICPHSLNNRSLVVSAEDEIVLEFGPVRNEREDEAILVVDGMVQRTLHNGERICIRRAEEKTKLIKLGKTSFFEVFHEKLGMGQDNS